MTLNNNDITLISYIYLSLFMSLFIIYTITLFIAIKDKIKFYIYNDATRYLVSIISSIILGYVLSKISVLALDKIVDIVINNF